MNNLATRLHQDSQEADPLDLVYVADGHGDPPSPGGEDTATQYTQAIDFLRDHRRCVVPMDYTEAHEIAQADQRLAWLWLTHAQDHIAVRLDAYLRGGHTGGQEAGAIIKGIALGLERASSSLFDAATRLKNRGDAHGASLTHQESVEIHKLFEEISGVSVSEEADL